MYFIIHLQHLPTNFFVGATVVVEEPSIHRPNAHSDDEKGDSDEGENKREGKKRAFFQQEKGNDSQQSEEEGTRNCLASSLPKVC